MPLLRLLHETRSKADKDYAMLLEDIADVRSQRAKNMVSRFSRKPPAQNSAPAARVSASIGGEP